MKKIFLFLAIASVFSFASCRKDRTCTCVNTFTDASTGTTISTTDVTVYTDSKKHDASVYCISTSNTDTNGDKEESKCTLK